MLFRIDALKFGKFKLTSGKLSPYYIDLRIVPSFPDVFHKICDFYVKLIESKVGIGNFKIVAGVPTGGIPFGAVVAYRLNKPFIYARSTQRKHGRERKVEGILNSRDKVLLLDDLITTGKSLVHAASIIKTEGGIVDDVVVLINREEGGEEELVKESLKLHYLLRASEAVNILNEIGVIEDRELKAVLEQMKTR